MDLEKVGEFVTSPWVLIVVLLALFIAVVKSHVFAAAFIFRIAGPASIVAAFPQAEPNSSASCAAAGGSCIPVFQQLTGTVDYGSCDAEDKCLIKDLCEQTGGVYVSDFIPLKNQYVKRCACPDPKVYKLATGCTQPFTAQISSNPVRSGGGGY